MDPAVVGSNPIIHPNQRLGRLLHMRVSVETTNGLERKVTVAVPAESIQKLLDEQVRNTASQVKLPGFRQGKVPLKVVRQRFGEKLRQEAAASLLQSSLNDAVAQERLSPAGEIAVNLETVAEGKDLEYTATFEVFPEFEIVPYSTLRVRKPETEIAESDVDNTVEQLRRQKVEWHPVERPARNDDRVHIDYSIEADGEMLQSREGQPRIVDDSDGELDKAIVGMSAAETRTYPTTVWVREPRAEAEPEVLELDHDDDHPDENDQQGDDATSDHAQSADASVAEQEASTPPNEADADDEDEDEDDLRGETRNAIGKVTLRTVEEPHLPELDDAFFDWFGVAEEDDRMAAFRSAVRARMEVELDAAIRRVQEREVQSALVAAHDFELPKALVAEEVLVQQARFETAIGELPEGFEVVLRLNAEQSVRTALVIRAIALREGITADDERVAARIAEIASGYEHPAEVRRFLQSDEEQLSRIESNVLREQVVEKVLAEATVTTVEMPYATAAAGIMPPLEDEEDEQDEAVDEHSAGEVEGLVAPLEEAATNAESSAPSDTEQTAAEADQAAVESEPATPEPDGETDEVAKANPGRFDSFRRLFRRNRNA